jgi:hypothetical protein
MVTSRSVPQQIEQILSARAGHCCFALRLLQIGHAKVHPGSRFLPPQICLVPGGGSTPCTSLQVICRDWQQPIAAPANRILHYATLPQWSAVNDLAPAPGKLREGPAASTSTT